MLYWPNYTGATVETEEEINLLLESILVPRLLY